MNWKAGFAALGGAVIGGAAGYFITDYVEKARGRSASMKSEGTGTLVGAALGMIVGASIPTSTSTTTTAITKT